jgi:hypothetical protein
MNDPFEDLVRSWRVPTSDLTEIVRSAIDSSEADLMSEIRALRGEMGALRRELAELREELGQAMPNRVRLSPLSRSDSLVRLS